jgi:hypothetical protein
MAEGKKTTELRRRKGKKKKIFILIHIPDTTTKTTKKRSAMFFCEQLGSVKSVVLLFNQRTYPSGCSSLSLSLYGYTHRNSTHTQHTHGDR